MANSADHRAEPFVDADDAGRPGFSITRRGLLAGAGAVVLAGVTAGAGVSASLPRVRLGATVEAPLRTADVARWHSDVDTLARHGQTLVRTAVHPWVVAPARRRWDDEAASSYREALAYARGQGLDVALVVPGAPDWAQADPFDTYVSACTWFWSAMVETFGDQVDLWQVFNEPDGWHYRQFVPVALDEAYLAELDQLLQTARGILGGRGTPVTTNVSGWPMNDQTEQVWNTVLDAVHGSLDVVSVDVYPADNLEQIALLPERLARLRQRYGLEVFVAEVGLQTTPGSWSEQDQRQFLTAAVDGIRSDQELWGVCLYQLRDQPDPAGFGIQLSDGTPKLGFADIMQSMG